MNIVGLIPVRLESSRLPNKAILKIAEIPMILHVANRAMLSKALDRVIVCTDSYEICDICIENKIEVVLTKSNHTNGTERIAEAAGILNLDKDTIIVDIQGDEPLLKPHMIDNVAEYLVKNKHFDIVVPFIEIFEEESCNRVKLVASNNNVIYMSRRNVPYPFLKDTIYKKHLSIIALRMKALSKFAHQSPTPLEEIEGIELLRAIEMGLKVGTFEEHGDTLAVDTIEDYERVQRLMLRDEIYLKQKND
ncbi:MAG: 3-deoxy-manno-octulosonate cytidylyltransferase [Candidatus Brocadiales bacterium]|nr:3-deoxy-manno-octulosonate cytidylyltransferase [Candidatus Brocadiales bacterium]